MPLPSELSHLSHPVPPAAPGAAPRARLSILAILGFLAAAAAVLAGAYPAGVSMFVSENGFAIVDELVRDSGGRYLLADLVRKDAVHVHGPAFVMTVGAVAVSIVLFALNAATLLSIGRRVGVRGRGYALFGMLLAGVFFLETGAASHNVLKVARDWRAISRGEPVAEMTRAHRLGLVSALSHRGQAGIAELTEIAAKDASLGVRYAATYALGFAAASQDQVTRDAARAALDARTSDQDQAIRDVATWGLKDPATRGPHEAKPRHGWRHGSDARSGECPGCAGEGASTF